MNYKCVWIVSFTDFFSSLDPPGKTILSTAEDTNERRFPRSSWNSLLRRIFFSILPHTRQLKLLLLIFCFDILNLKLFDFETEKGKENK